MENIHGSLNVPMFHITQPLDSIRYMVYNGYYKMMSNIPKMGHLTTPDIGGSKLGQLIESRYVQHVGKHD